ncbi:MAG: leucine-rich repeat domain-containing protein [Bryobacteraceae bacterium]
MHRRSLGIAVFALGWTFSPGATAAQEPLFPDPELEALVRQSVFSKRDNKQPLTAEDVKSISTLTARGKAIKSLEGLEKCTALAMLEIFDGQVTDLTPIANLTNIQSLTFKNNRIADAAPLAGLTKLQYIDLSGNQIASAQPFSKLEALNSLFLSGNKIADAAPLAGLKRLWSLYLDGNHVKDVTALGGLKNLSSLDLRGNRITSVAALSGLNNLKYLMLDGNPLRDIAPLIAMAKKDGEGEKRFAPFWQVYLIGCPIPIAQAAELRKFVHTVVTEKRN